MVGQEHRFFFFFFFFLPWISGHPCYLLLLLGPLGALPVPKLDVAYHARQTEAGIPPRMDAWADGRSCWLSTSKRHGSLGARSGALGFVSAGHCARQILRPFSSNPSAGFSFSSVL